MSGNETLSQKSIRRYIKDTYNPGALLVTGEWGSGKTFFLNNLAEELNHTKRYAIANISLFGLSSSEEIEKAVKTELCYVYATPKGSDKDKNNTNKLIKGLRALTEKFKDDSKIVGAIDDVINFNYWDFIGLSPTIKGRKVILIFDDFERCIISTDLLLGIVNEYSENIGIKVIIVANEDKLHGIDNYKEFKEKVIYKTIKIEQDNKFVLSTLINNYCRDGSEYQKYLLSNFNIILDIFERSKYNNFRSIKTAIYDFQKIYSLFLEKTSYKLNHIFEANEEKALSFLLGQFFVFTLETCAGNNISDDLTDYFYGGFENNSISIPYFSKYNNVYFDITQDYDFMLRWIADGIYNENDIKRYIEQCIDKYTNKKSTDLCNFLNNEIRRLDYGVFNEGFKAAKKKAHNGDLNCVQYLKLIDRSQYALKKGLISNDDINYGKIEEGFKKHDMSNDKDDFYTRSPYLELSEYDEEAKKLYETISFEYNNKEKNNKKTAYYKKCIDFFSNINNLDEKSLNFETHDTITIDLTDELIDKTINSYSYAYNSYRSTIYDIFFKINFSEESYVEQMKKLKRKLEEIIVSDKIGNINREEFIHSIEEKLNTINQEELF
ncbi:MAG TPA: P-loop NTPase fold protein [Ruminococcus flavefaciens]|mgnify:CR=1 FL=1|nr:P-loop NTPase fold protein [Ruminococcus flavefaciens]